MIWIIIVQKELILSFKDTAVFVGMINKKSVHKGEQAGQQHSRANNSLCISQISDKKSF